LATLGQICERPQYGWTTSADFNGKGLKLLRTTDISSGSINWDTVPFCKQEPDEPRKYLLNRGDILVSRAGSVGVSIEIDECPKAIFASYLIRFKPISPIPSRFISFYLKSPSYWSSITDNTAGIAIPNVNASKLKTLQIPLPPLNEQKRIVEKIEILLDRLNKTKQELAKILPLLKKFRQSVLVKAFSGELTKEWRKQQKDLEPASYLLERIRHARKKKLGKKYKEPEPIDISDLPRLPEGWAWIRLDIVARVERGKFSYRPRNEPRFYNGKYPFIQTGDIANSNGRIKGYKQTLNENGLAISKLFPKGTIMIAIAANIGDSAILEIDACATDSVVGITPYEDILAEYLEYYLRTKKSDLESFAPATAQKNINLRILNPLPISIAPVQEQKEIVLKINKLFSQADTIEKSVKIAQTHCEKLSQSILSKAFRGELVEQEPNDEPAVVLLKK